MKTKHEEFNEKMGKRIMKLRIRENYTREYLAEMTGISPKFLYEIENGKKGCSAYILSQIAASLRVPVSDFFQEDPKYLEKNATSCYLKFDEAQKEKLNTILRLIYELIRPKR